MKTEKKTPTSEAGDNEENDENEDEEYEDEEFEIGKESPWRLERGNNESIL